MVDYANSVIATPVGAREGRKLDWRKGMSDNIAYALLVYTGLHIFMTMQALESGGSSSLPLVALVILVAAIIPLCRRFERRWEAIGDEAASDPALSGAYRRDQMLIWALAIGLPVGLTLLCKAVLPA